DLIVARAAGVELGGGRAGELDQTPLHVHVDVLEFSAERKRAGFDLAPHGVEALQNRLALVGGEQSGPPERTGPRRASRNVMQGEAAVECERRGEALGRGIGAPGEPARPGLAGLGAQDSRAAMSAMTRAVTLCRASRTVPATPFVKQRGGPKRTRSGCSRGI